MGSAFDDSLLFGVVAVGVVLVLGVVLVAVGWLLDLLILAALAAIVSLRRRASGRRA